MKDKWVFILAAMISVLSAAQQPSDLPETHGKGLNSYCRGCHNCDEPVIDAPCLIDCPRHQGKFFGRHNAEDGPNIVILDQLSSLYSGVIFQHNLHAKMAEMGGGCDLCHHFSEPDAAVPPCRECHVLHGSAISISKPSLKAAYHRQCLNCHREWSHETDCVLCHAVNTGKAAQSLAHDSTDIMGVTHPRIEAESRYVYTTNFAEFPIVTFHHRDHVELFGERCVDCHRGDSCLRCHEEGHKTESHKIALPGDTSKQTCCQCHTVACTREEDCVFCHQEQEQPPFSHASSTGWNPGNRHSGVACQSCHGPASRFMVPSTRCTGCHIHWDTGIFDHRTTGLTLNDDHVDFECENCHVDEDFPAPPTCENCHDEDDISYPDSLPGMRE